MSGIFGYLHAQPQSPLPQSPLPQSPLSVMAAAMQRWGPDGGGLWQDAQCGLGQRLLFNTPEALHERLPRWVEDARLAITAEARIDNRDELCDHFAIPHADRPTTPDSDLILRAYLQWGEESPDHLLGDWSFAVWHPDKRKLFLARDHHGNSSLVYWQTRPGDSRHFAFASDPAALYAIGAPRRLNELYLAQVLISWSAYHGPQTIDLDIQRLPPAHAMTVTPQGTRVWRYWRLEDTPELRLPNRDDYVQGFLEVYDRAVRDRLRSHRPVGVTLSGGLDSGSVTALAARELARQGRRITAFTAVPLYDTSQTVGPKRFGDETHFASLTAAHWPNVDHHLLDSAHITPLQGIHRTLAIMPEPAHAASNYFWITDLLEQAQAMGLGTLLTGQGGNATVSWIGAPELRSRLAAFRHGGLKEGVRRTLPLWALRAWMARRLQGHTWSGAAIHADFARRVQLGPRRVAALGRDITTQESWHHPRDKRYAIIQPGASRVGDLWARQGAAVGLEVRDPTFDKRVMAYALAVPDAIFDSPDGADRWMIRAAMAGLLPDAVRLNRQRGRQSADVIGRLLASQDEVEAALAAVDASPANAYVDVAKMRRAWADVQAEATALSTHRAGTILLRGLLAGIFLNGESSARET
jgi:asparagine synthase (glutamine-hydrolysing)